jgi:2-methylcitrate dehydratase
MALLEGKIDNSSYAPKKFKDTKTLNFLKKVTVVEDKDLTAMYPGAVANRVTVKLTTGKVISKQVNYHKGHPKNPMSDQDVERKFRTLTKRQLSESQAKRSLGMLWTLEKVNDLSKLFSALVVG